MNKLFQKKKQSFFGIAYLPIFWNRASYSLKMNAKAALKKVTVNHEYDTNPKTVRHMAKKHTAPFGVHIPKHGTHTVPKGTSIRLDGPVNVHSKIFIYSQGFVKQGVVGYVKCLTPTVYSFVGSDFTIISGVHIITGLALQLNIF